MIKKLIIIFILILFIVLMSVGVCYADSNEFIITPTQQNYNITNVDLLNVSGNNPLPTLKTNGYNSVFSRYSTPIANVRIDLNIDMEFTVTCSTYNDASYNYYRDYILSYSNIDNVVVRGQNVDKTNLNFSLSTNRSSSYYTYRFILSGYLLFDIVLNNSYFLDGVYPNNYNYQYGFIVNMPYDKFTLYDYSYKTNALWVFPNKLNYTVTYVFDRIISNIDGFVMEDRLSLSSTNNILSANFTDNRNFIINGSSREFANSQGLAQENFQIVMANNSSLKSVSYTCSKTTSAVGKSLNPTNNGLLSFNYVIYTPVFYQNNVDFIQSSTNVTNTPLKLQYYDCKWYELHYQLANAFIFMITELPIVSDVTNVIYSVVNLGYISIDVLQQFSGFGYLFAFIMFAVIFGIFSKIVLGD